MNYHYKVSVCMVGGVVVRVLSCNEKSVDMSCTCSGDPSSDPYKVCILAMDTVILL